jgi:hypothetical protein
MDDLVVYRGGGLDLAKHVRVMHRSLSDLNPEVRIPSGEEMYVGGVRKISIDETGLRGQAYIHNFRIFTPETPRQLTTRIMGSLFGEATPTPYSIDHDNKRYIANWRVVTNQEFGREKELIHLNHFTKSLERTNFVACLKTEVATSKGVLLSNELLGLLFDPIVDSLETLYSEIASF